MTIARIFAALLAFAAFAHADDAQQTTVFKGGEGAYKVYRIPAAIMTTKGTLLAFAEGRQAKGDSGEIHLIVKRSSDGGATFGETSVVWSDGPNTCGNPCPVVDRSTGTIWLLMTHNPGNTHEKEITPAKARGTRTVWITSSTDDGLTWSALNSNGFTAGPYINYLQGRTSNGSLQGLRNVSDMAEVGGFVQYAPADFWRVYAQLGQAVGDLVRAVDDLVSGFHDVAVDV